MTESFFRSDERRFVSLLLRLGTGNPFLPERIQLEREALGRDFVAPASAVWSKQVRVDRYSQNVAQLAERADALIRTLRSRIEGGSAPAASRDPAKNELELYQDLVLYALYYRFEERFEKAMTGGAGFFEAFEKEARSYLAHENLKSSLVRRLPHAFSFLFQVRRASHFIFNFIVGSSMPAARLRARVWESIFTHNINRYRRHLYDKMGDVSTLITGASGTGKEIVARSIASARYVPYQVGKKRFALDIADSFYPLNLSALAPTLIESELFGHQRGAFTGALQDRQGWLEVCPALGSVFLDEIGELDSGIQVKLLRVLQSRQFQKLGDTKPHHFKGKILAATNRDLAKGIASGSFREDFYYRLCSDIVTTPTLEEQLSDTPEDLNNFVLFLATRMVGGDEAETVTEEVVGWIHENLSSAYSWPGNVRELEQCVRNVVIRKDYRPVQRPQNLSIAEKLTEGMRAGRLSAEELVQQYCTMVYAETQSYVETARRLGLDRRTVKARVDSQLLDQLRNSNQ